MHNEVVARWHRIVESGDAAGLDELLAEDVVFHSPVVHTPQRGKALTTMYLTAAVHVLGGDGFRYVREVVGDRDAALEFTTTVDGILINGIDLFHWNEDGRIDDFKVMIRPLKAVNLLHRMMGEMLEQLAPKA
jgi:hypothetical protein